MSSHAGRPSRDHRQHPPVAEDALGGRADVGLGHRADEGVAAADIVDAEALEGNLGQGMGNLGRGVEAQRIGTDEIVLGLLQLLVGGAFGRQLRHLTGDDVESLDHALVLGGGVAPGHGGRAVAHQGGADAVGEAALLAHLLEQA